MKIEKELSGAVLTVTVSGRLDTKTAPALEQELKVPYGEATYAELYLALKQQRNRDLENKGGLAWAI